MVLNFATIIIVKQLFLKNVFKYDSKNSINFETIIFIDFNKQGLNIKIVVRKNYQKKNLMEIIIKYDYFIENNYLL